MRIGNICVRWILFSLILIAQRGIAQEFRIVGYYSLEAARTVKPGKIPFKYLTHINLFFLNPDSAGNFTRDFSAIKPFIDAAHKKGVRVLVSIAGGSPHPYYHALLQDDRRPEFIASLIKQTTQYNLDGIDVDIEGGDIDDNYEAFVVELAAALRSEKKMITAAVAVYYKDHVTDVALSQYDFINIMSYDRTGPWRPHEPGAHAPYQAAVDDVDYFGSTRQIPKEKMTLGVPFYAYGFGPELTSPATSQSFARLIKSSRRAERKDELTTVSGQHFYYNGIPTIREKTRLAKDKCSGIMIWQIRQDAKGRKSLLKAIYQESHAK